MFHKSHSSLSSAGARDVSAHDPFLTNHRGQSLVQVLISIGIMGILMATMATMFSNQSRETTALSQKLASADLEKILISSLSDGSVCQYIVNHPSPLTFDSTKVSPSTPQIITPTLPIYASVQPGPPAVTGPVVAQVGQLASPYSTSATIGSITLSISGAPSPLPPPGPGVIFTGNWVVTIDKGTLIRTLVPNTVSTALVADTTNPNAAIITGCSGNSVGGIGGYATFIAPGPFTFTVPTGVSKIKVTAVGGGGGGGGSAGTTSLNVSAGIGANGGTVGIGIYAVIPNSILSGVVGAGGNGGSPGNSGAPGSASSLAGYLIAPGGHPAGGSPQNPPPLVEAPSSATNLATGGTLYNGAENSGQGGVAGGCANVMGGAGGPGPWGGGGSSAANNLPGGNAGAAGGGGGGGSTQCNNPAGNPGGNGFSGMVIIEY